MSLQYKLIAPNTITILATYKCTAACKNCCFDSNPNIQKKLSYDYIESFIEEVLALNSVELVVFSGGECFLLKDDLVKAVKYVSSRGIKTRCVSNGYWAKNYSTGKRILSELVDAGLNELNISTGDFHQEWVSQQTVFNACQLGVELNLESTLLVIEVQKERKVSKDKILEDEKFSNFATQNIDKFAIIESPWMPMSKETDVVQYDSLLLNSNNLNTKKGCQDVFRTIVLNPDNKVGFCCGLTREKIPNLNSSWEKNKLTKTLANGIEDFFKIWLQVDGPEKIIAWAASKNPEIEWENKFAHNCHVCFNLWNDQIVFETITKFYHERIDDVLMRFRLSNNFTLS